MFNKLRRLIQRFFRKSSTLNRQSLNVPSLIVIVLVDIFILANVFFGLNDISSWHLSPNQTYPCYTEWQNYRESKEAGKDYEMLRRSITRESIDRYAPPRIRDIRADYQQAEVGHLGKVAPQCLEYAGWQDAVRSPDNIATIVAIDNKLTAISRLEDSNRSIRSQYDSTLLEKVAGQPRNQSINNLSAEQAKQKTDANTAEINKLKQEVTNLKQTLLAQPPAQALLAQLQTPEAFGAIEKGYRHAAFWYPSIQLGFQALFLLPLIAIAYAIHRFAVRKNYGLVALISWHLLIIATIPALLKVFEFLQVGVLFQWIATTISRILGGLLFLVSYVQIALIPLVGFGLIKLIQRLSKASGNAQTQAANRIAQSRCLRCAKKVREGDAHCAHCGYQQYADCPNCHAMTHRQMPHCTHCGGVTGFDVNLSDRLI
jgi:ABC-type multidrug transport system fused ATPase/permease subunit